jgi:hypothetical protein
MVGHGLTDTELVEILSKSEDSSSGSSIFSDSSDNKIDDLAVVDAIINYDSDGKEETYKTFLWETMDKYSGQKAIFRVESVQEIKLELTFLNALKFSLIDR